MPKTTKKKRGRPATGKGEPIMVRVQPKLLRDLDSWIRSHDAGLSRPEGIRRILETALSKISNKLRGDG